MIIGVIRDGKYITRDDPDFYADNNDDKPLKGIPAIRSDKPFVSQAAAIHVDQVEKFNQQLRDNKVSGAYYRRSDGNLVCESRSARNKVLKMRCLRDGDAGYGDYAGRND